MAVIHTSAFCLHVRLRRMTFIIKLLYLQQPAVIREKQLLAGFADVPGTGIIVFYPKNGVSPVQEKQMITQRGNNTYVVGITGNFDDAQTRR